MILENADYCVRIVTLPDGVHGCVSEDADGYCSVYLNAKDSHERRYRAYEHEKKHIINGDFSKDDVRDAEGYEKS